MDNNEFNLKIKNFQSLKDVDIDIPNGITIITGKTNSGKSSIFRAFDSAIFNTCDDSLIKSGKDSCKVEFYNGKDTLYFSRNKKVKSEKTTYKINSDKEIKKVGRTQLEEVGSIFGIKDVKLNNNTKVKVNFWYQNDKPFLMDKTAGQLYEYLSMSSCDKYYKVLKIMEKDIKSMESDKKELTIEINTIKKINEKKKVIILNNDGYEEVYKRTMELDRIDSYLNKISSMLENLSEIDKVKNNSKKRIESIINKINELSFIDSYENTISKISKLESNIATLNNYIDKYSKLITLLSDKKYELSNIEKEIVKVNSLDIESKEKKLSNIDSESNEINYIINKINDVHMYKNDVDNKLSKLNLIEAKINNTNSEYISTEINNIESKEVEYNSIISLLNKYSSIKSDIYSHTEKLSSIKEELTNCEKELDKYDVCPFCGSVI